MKRRTLRRRQRGLIALAAVIVTSFVLPASTASAAPAFDRSLVVTALQQLVAAGAPAAVVRAVDESGTWSAAVGVSDVKTGQPADPDSAFRIGSISKMFMSVAILQQVNAGVLNLDAPVDRYLPGLLSQGNVVTLRELLEHRAGLAAIGVTQTHWGFQGGIQADCHQYVDPISVVRAADQQVYPPGTNWIYSNADYTALQLILERVTGKPYMQALNDSIVAPLGLQHTSFQDGKPVWPGPYLHGYGDYKHGLGNYLDQHMVDNTDCETYNWGAAGSGISTTSDLMVFMHALTSGELLPDDLYQQMTTGIFVDPAHPTYYYGLGIEDSHTSCGRIFGHSGEVFGYESELLTNGTRTLAVDMNILTYRPQIIDAFFNVIYAEFCQ
jgi:D-alanyl-D-alanine carboxypeptidase